MSEIISIKLSEIDADPAFQPREKLNPEALEEYAALIVQHRASSTESPLPPVTVYKIEGKENYVLCSGFHRLEANKIAKSQTIEAIVKHGTQKDLLEESIKSNQTNGVHYSREDKRRCIILVLQNPDFYDWTDHAISQLCKVSNHLVAKVRNELNSATQVNTQSRPKKIQEPKFDDQIPFENKIITIPSILNSILELIKTNPGKMPLEIQESIRSFVESYSNLSKGE